MRFYLIDPTQHFIRFLFPNRIDDYPLPKMSPGKWHLYFIKGINLLLLLGIHAALFFAIAVFIFKRMGEALVWLSIGLLPVAFLAVMGWVEQRYLASSHYFFIMAISGLTAVIIQRLRPAPQAR
jgi:hypothetical protein